MRDVQDVDVLSGERSAPRPLLWTLPAAAVSLAADQLTKRWALANLDPAPACAPGDCIDLFGGLKLHLVFNTGATFSTGTGYGPIIGVLAILLIGGLLYIARQRTDRLGALLFGLIIGGALGNLSDRAFRATDGFLSGAVVDFIDPGWWPVFNIADASIIVGVVAVMALTWIDSSPKDNATSDEAGPATDDSGS